MKRFYFVLALLFLAGITVQYAQAAGIGIYGTGGVSAMNWQYDGNSTGKSTDYFGGCGLVIDSNVAKDSLFSYRFTGGYEQYRMSDPDTGSKSPGLHRVSMSHTLGFGLYRSNDLRLWVGPQIGMHYLMGEYSTTKFFFIPKTVRVDYLGLDILLGAGFNFNVGEAATVFFDLGLGYMGNYNLNDTKYIGNAFGFQAKAGIMFRINDKYTAAGKGNG
jgi:hypothetical protein